MKFIKKQPKRKIMSNFLIELRVKKVYSEKINIIITFDRYFIKTNGKNTNRHIALIYRKLKFNMNVLYIWTKILVNVMQ